MPLYFREVRAVRPVEILAHRIVWCLVLLAVVLTAWRRWPAFGRCLRSPRLLALLFVTALLVGGNWLIYIYSVASGRVSQSSLGYFILPLFSMFLGMIFFRERLRPWQWAAVALAAAGVLYHVAAVGETPWIALGLAVTFGVYGLIRKVAGVDGLVGVAVEALLLAPAALALLAWDAARGANAFGRGDGWVDGLLLASGLVTAVPLVCFGEAARRLPLTTLGFLQYLAPSLQLALAVLLFKEPFGVEHAISFGLIWAGLAIFSVESILARYQQEPASLPVPAVVSENRIKVEAYWPAEEGPCEPRN
jgi:chloramphenicol-sensitive protein RarD